MKLLFNFLSLLVLIAYCLYIDGNKIQVDEKNIKASLDKIVSLTKNK